MKPFVITLFQILFFVQTIMGQDSIPERNAIDTREDQQAFLNRYLSNKGAVEDKINELILFAQKDEANHFTGEALHKVQIALILEKQVVHPNKTTFRLNAYAGDLIRSINKKYALDFYKKATSIIGMANDISATDKFILYTNRAGLHAYFMEYDSAIHYFHNAIDEAKFDSHSAEASSINNLGVYYQNLGKPDSAHLYFQKALGMIDQLDPGTNLYCAIKDNIAQLDILRGDDQLALPTFQYNDSVYFARKQANRYIVNKVRLLETMKKMNFNGIEEDMQSLPSYIDSNQLQIKPEVILEYYTFAYSWFFDHHDREKQQFYFKRYIELNEQHEKDYTGQLDQLTSTLLMVQQNSFENELSAHELLAERNNLKLRTTRMISAIIILSAALVISLLIFYIRKRRQEYEVRQRIVASELKRSEMEARLVREELEWKKRDLTNIVLHNTQVFDANQKIIERIQDISKKKDLMESNLRSLLTDLQSQNQITERANGIQANIESVNAEFYQKLKKIFPDLTKAETELCGYIRINLSSKDISILKNVEASSVKMGKNRLRKKLDLNQDSDLYAFIQGL